MATYELSPMPKQMVYIYSNMLLDFLVPHICRAKNEYSVKYEDTFL